MACHYIRCARNDKALSELFDESGHYCGVKSSTYCICTRTLGHYGPHVAHAGRGRICEAWYDWPPELEVDDGF